MIEHVIELQHDPVPYDATYLRKVEAYEGNEIARRVNDGRCALLGRYVKQPASVLDIGAGTGEFVRAARSWGFDAVGYEVIADAASALQEAGLFAYLVPACYDAVTMWDVIEHIERPEEMLRQVYRGAYFFASTPIVADINRRRESKHYRPGEHLHYWTRDGFVSFVESCGFKLLEASDHEVVAGRDSIGAFAFQRDT